MDNLEDFDSVIVGTYKGDRNFYYKLVVLDMGLEKNEAFSNITKIHDTNHEYVLFAKTDDFLSYTELDFDVFNCNLCFYISPLSSWPGIVFDGRESIGDFLELPEAVFLNDGRIYVGKGLLKVPEFMNHFSCLLRNVGEIFRDRENILERDLHIIYN